MQIKKRILLIAFHFPPFSGSSGHLRTLSFSRYLPHYGWEPIVLTARPEAYPQINLKLANDIPAEVKVCRAFAFDIRKIFSVIGAYPSILAQPDRWWSWWLGAVPAGMKLIKKYKPQILWSTYPTPTAHLIACTLHKITGLPWVADFRDPMNEDDADSGKIAQRIRRWIINKTINHSSYAVFTTPGAARLYKNRYPRLPESHWVVIPNGYDEENFTEFRDSSNSITNNHKVLKLVHSGHLYKEERDPRPFFSALARLKAEKKIIPGEIKIILRACGNDKYFTGLINAEGISDLVYLEPPVSYNEALKEMQAADGLLIFQGKDCNHQIPAKIYEYFRARRPILALTDPEGDTAQLMTSAAINTIARIDSSEHIEECLIKFLQCVREKNAPIATEEEISRHSRKYKARELAALLDTLVE